MRNKGWYFEEVGRLVPVENEVPLPSAGEVVVRVAFAGICGSDLHAFRGEHPLVAPGKILGHEFSGEIFSVGEDVRELSVGLHVVIEPSITCGRCYNCTHGRYNICADLSVIRCVDHDGGFQEFVAVPAKKAYPLEEIPLDVATLVEPFAVAVHGVRISGFRPGDEALVIGAGPIGLLTCSFLVRSGARRVVVLDLIEERLSFAKELLPEIAAIKSEEFSRNLFSSEGPDLVFECVGLDDTINAAINYALKGTEVVLMGVPAEESSINFIFVQDRELKITGSLMYVKEDYLIALDMLRRARIDFSRMITRIFDFGELPQAFEHALKNKRQAVKTFVRIGN